MLCLYSAQDFAGPTEYNALKYDDIIIAGVYKTSLQKFERLCWFNYITVMQLVH